MKRIFSVFLALSFLVILTAGCSNGSRSDDGKIKIVCTIFPQYDWTRQIIGDNADNFALTLLLDSGVDLHSYTPTIPDMATVKSCDIFIYTGGHSDAWVEDALRDANPDMVTLNLMEILGDLIITDRHDAGDCDIDHDHDEEHIDEHIWLSLRNAQVISRAIANVLSEKDPENAQAYQENLTAYTAKLSDLDEEYKTAVDAANVKTLVFADRFPFRYMTNDYGLAYYAAFSGCSAETEAGFITRITLAKRLEHLDMNTMLVTESSDKSVAEAVNAEYKKENPDSPDRQILVLNAMQSVTRRDVDNGASYLSIMESNLEVLKEALS